jgi:GT2 family glycosyltransferase
MFHDAHDHGLGFSPDLLRALVAYPERQTDVRPWQGHVPFARWLVATAQPRRIVELGVHKGDSLCAFCEAAVWFGTETRVHGVDLWQGDEHAGRYGDEVYEELNAYFQAHYGHFATLHRTTFDAAASDFDNRSIDLLHIDGLHTYNAVANDFTTWLPKLSDRGVVILHDIAETGRDFGVWRLWDDLSRDYATFRMDHNHGLGMAVVGSHPPGPVASLANAENATQRATASAFERLGAVVAAGPDQRQLHAEISSLREQNARQQRTHDELAQYLEKLRFDLETTRVEATEIQAWAQEIDGWARGLNQELQLVYASRSWRVTRPLRAAVEIGRAPTASIVRVLRRVLHDYPGIYRTLRAGYRAVRPYVDRLRRQRSAGPGDTADAARERWRAHAEAAFADFIDSHARLSLPESDAPRASIVLVLYNQAALTYQALQAIEHVADVPSEVIIVDNASQDRTAELLDRITGACVVRNETNVGFLEAVNQAGELAKGAYLVLLNNDAVLRPGALSAALAVFETEPAVGAVGGRIVLPEGSLQEAGSIVWRDGSCQGYARGRPADAPEALFRRDVDFCSGAFLSIRTDLFHVFGGFDRSYAPAYYEETDFCVRLLRAGWRVIYEPTAVIDHLEFGSSASADHAIAQQEKNRAKFVSKHADWLQHQEPPHHGGLLRARMRHPGAGRVLYIDDVVPDPSLGSGYPRACYTINTIAGSGRFVTMYPAVDPHGTDGDSSELAPTVEIARGWGSDLASFMRARQGYYDTIIVSRPHNMELLMRACADAPALRAGARLVYDAEAVFARRRVLEAEVRGAPYSDADAEDIIRAEVNLATEADHVITVNQREADEFRSRGFPNVSVIGHAMQPQPTQTPFESRAGILFVGRLTEDTSPNADSLKWFCERVLRHLHTAFDGAPPPVYVVGRADAPMVRDLRQYGIRLIGKVPDVTPFYAACRIFVAPTRFAAGIPHKVHEAAAHGLPSVVTPLLCDQLGWQPEHDVLVGDTPEAFARACRRAYIDGGLWHTLHRNAIDRLRAECDPAAYQAALEGALSSAGTTTATDATCDSPPTPTTGLR